MILKKFNLFESENNEDMIHFGVSIDDLKFYFTDLIDLGYNLRIYPTSTLVDMRLSSGDNIFKLGLIKYISVNIWFSQTLNNIHNYRRITESEEFKGIIEESNDRLKDHGLFIKEIIPYSSHISILIYREIDKKNLQLK